MTSNQIANRANELQKAYNEATEAHWRRGDDESARHNQVVEGIQTRTNEISELVQKENARHNRANEAITAQVNLLNAEIHYATEARKAEIQEQLAMVEKTRAMEDAKYKRAMAELDKEANSVKQQLADEEIRHNLELEGLEQSKVVVSKEQTRLREREIHNQAVYWEGVLAGQETTNQIKWFEAQTASDLGYLGLRRDVSRLELDATVMATQVELMKTQAMQNYINGLNTTVRTLNDVIKSQLILEGGAYGSQKKSNKQNEFIFSESEKRKRRAQ